MTVRDPADPILELLGQLPSATPLTVSVERVRARSHAVLSQRHRRQTSQQTRRLAGHIVDSVAYCLGFLYLAGAVAKAVMLSRFGH